MPPKEAKTEDRMRGGGDHHHRTTDAYPFPFLQTGESELDGGVAHDARWRTQTQRFIGAQEVFVEFLAFQLIPRDVSNPEFLTYRIDEPSDRICTLCIRNRILRI